MPYSLILATLSVFLVNLPFGFWRTRSIKFSWQWFLFIHLPIPFVILLRFYFELGFEFYTYPFLLIAFFLGQYSGGKLYLKYGKRRDDENSN
jgi:hypothetical protein